MLTKEKVISILNDLPDTFPMDELIDKLLLLEKIETGLEQSKKGEVFSSEAVKKLLNSPISRWEIANNKRTYRAAMRAICRTTI